MQASLRNPDSQELVEPENSFFQVVDLLHFKKDSMADSLLLDELNLEGQFEAMEVDVLAASAPIKAVLEKPDATTWIVRLPRPMPLRRIHVREITAQTMFAAETFIQAGFLDFLIAEGVQSLSAAAVVHEKTAKIRDQVAKKIAKGEIIKISAGSIEIYPVVGDTIMSQSIATVTNNSVINDLVLEAFAVRAQDASPSSRFKLLAAQHQISVSVHSMPQALELLVAPVEDDDVPQLEKNILGNNILDKSIKVPGLAFPSNQETIPLTDTGIALKKAAQQCVDENFTRDDSTDYTLAIIMRSENPCRFTRSLFSNHYRLGFRDTQMYTNANEETVNTQAFDGDHWQSQAFSIQIPVNCILRSAVLPFKQTFNKKPFALVNDAQPENLSTTSRGVEISAELWTGGLFDVTTAQAVDYLLVPLMATAENTTCALEIREDRNGHPSGAIITAQSLPINSVGRRAWMSIPLRETLSLFTGKLWWLLKTRQGSAVQFVRTSDPQQNIVYFHISETGGPGRVARVSKAAGVQPLFAKTRKDGNQLHAFFEAPAASSPQTISPGANQWHFDLLPQLQASQSALETSARIHIASLLKGKAHLHPVELSYELPSPV
ncbi:hypothetical protein [Teredinibacter turnerae]|uniref:hypothetical protein n=1 Tax=Teredinibacter turnerae TaxID=2426 RepID=UPI00040AFCF5|nr:hypothetical protein [Teredinibacter turnerae]